MFVEIPLVNRIRPRVQAWREAGHPGVSGITKRLLEHWTNPEEFDARRFFFCQIEAAETLIWLTEAPAADKVGIDILSDGGDFRRLCAKMATGSGKTVVMAMVIAWHVLNKVAHPQDARFAKNVLVIAPGLTVRNRLAVLEPSHPENYYEAFRVVPSSLLDKLRQGKVAIRNWHVLNWETEQKIAGKRGRTSAAPRATKPMCARYWAAWRVRGISLSSTTRRTRLAGSRRVQDQRRRQGSNRGSDQIDRRPRPNQQGAQHSGLLRFLRHALRTVRQTELRRGAV